MPTKKIRKPFATGDLRIKPIERSETVPSVWYTDPAIAEIEKDRIFGPTWQFIGHTSKVKNPGDQIIGTAAGNPILIVRGKDDVVRAFYNVCRHRGGPIALEDGCSNVLQCKYHGWTYLLDGSLRGVPQFDRVELFDKKDFGLVPVKLAEWEGMLFVCLDTPVAPLERYLKGIHERIAPINLASKKFYRRVTYTVNCNWKAYVDNYLEGYHLPHVHPELCNLLDYREYVTETAEYHSLQHSPFTGKDNVYNSKDGEAFYYFVYPNFMMNILPGRLQTNLVLPISVNQCQVIFDYYYDDITSHSAIKIIEDDISYSDKIQQEDIEICQHVQRGLESRAYDRGRFSVECEQGVYHFQTLIKKAFQRGNDQ
ncbi:MAG TPA: aromatic ring-hydroxylating dioxygenase subunit alpha [Bacteroidota bacterium]|nr:aromatic ring-hydroxylating dioxygenase subunit alpha [Bacteroidota bacterium]